MSCTEELPVEEGIFDNPLDEDEVSYETPALTFSQLSMMCLLVAALL